MSSESNPVPDSIIARAGLIWLADAACRDPSLVGNKAAVLAGLRQAGYNVPDGFALSAQALAQGSDAWEPMVGMALRRLRAPWAARSSSTVEDSRSAAYPGLFVTVLDLSDIGSVVDAIHQVHASKDGDAVRAYAAHHDVDASSIQMAVLIQSLVVADSAGVAFTRDPFTGNREVVIEANYGFGETVVDGSVTPDAYWLGEDGKIVRRRIGSKREKIVATTSAARLRRLPTSELERSASVLSEDDAARIAKTARRLESDLGFPTDMEWALARGELFVLQARPITAAPPERPTGYQ